MKILCLGNGDNFGVRTYLWLKEAGADVRLVRLTADENTNRGNPRLYLKGNECFDPAEVTVLEDGLARVRKISLLGGGLIPWIHSEFDLVLVTGGWHALLYSRRINVPKIFLPHGAEVHTNAILHRGLPTFSELRNGGFRTTLRKHWLGWLVRSSLRRVQVIVSWFPPNTPVLKSLGLENRTVAVAFGEDVKRNRSLVDRSLLTELEAATVRAKRVLLWFSRVNFLDPGRAAYKGADIFLKALESVSDELRSGELVVYMGRHGNDIEQFKLLAERSPVHGQIRWVDHLDYPQLLAYLSVPRGVLFSEFGEVNAGITGIGRDGYTVGIPMVNSTRDEMMALQYGCAGPRLYADSVETAARRMREVLAMSDSEYAEMREKTIEYGEKYVGKDHFISRILTLAKALVAGGRP